MIRMSILRRAALGFALTAATFAAATPASAFSYANGDLVVTFVKNSTELILNLGTTPTGPTGATINASTLSLPSAFGGSLAGATWTALSVRNPDGTKYFPDLDVSVAQNNISLTTNANPSVVTYNQIGDAQAALQPANQGVAWFALLKTIGAANGTSILENSSTRLVIGTGLSQSYSGNVGLGSNAIANTLTISTAGVVSTGVIGDALPLYELTQNLLFDQGIGDFVFNTTTANLGSVRLVPEPGTLLLLTAGLAGLAHFGRRES